MWKSSSRGITARLRAVSQRKTDVRRSLATETVDDEPRSHPFKDPEKEKTGQKKSKRSAGKFAFRSLAALTAATVGVGGYAWYNYEFREKVATNVPYAKDAFDAVFVFLPESPGVPAPLLSKDKVKQEEEQVSFMKKKPPTPEPIVQPNNTSPPPPSAAPPTSQLKTEEPIKPPDKPKEKVLTAKEIQENKKKAEKEAEERKKADAAAENAALEVALEGLVEVSSLSVEKALSMVDEAINATKKHTEMLRAAMNDKSGDGDKVWDEVVAAYGTLEKASDAGDKALAQAWEHVDMLRSKVDSGRENIVTKTNRILNTARDKHNKFRQELTRKIEQLAKVERESKAQLQFKTIVEKGKQQLKKEMESLSPDLKFSKGGKLTDEEVNLMIAHAHKRIEQLQSELAAQVAFERQRTDSSLEQQKDRDRKLIEEAVQDEKEKLKFQLDTELQEREKQIKDKYHKAMIDERYRMEEWKDRETERKLKEQEEELKEEYRQLSKILQIEERENFMAEMAEWIGRIKGFDKAISSRAESEELAEQAQKLWLACLALNGAIRVGHFIGETWEAQLKPLEKEVDAVFDAAENNPFILLVLQTVPEKALTRGVFTEDNLKSRFEKVHRVARRVALIDETGGTLFKYFVSWMQSFFVASGTYTVHAKGENDEVNIAAMDTFELLTNAKYWVDKGDLELALRFMNQLKGESRRVAADWIEETRLLLETRQASYTLMAFASAQGLGTIF